MTNPIGRLLRNRRAGHHTLVWARLDGPESFTLTSPAFEHQTAIPERLKGRVRGPNLSPELSWTTPPQGTAELVLIVEDPDVPMRTAATHAAAVGIAPTTTSLPEGALAHPSPVPGVMLGKSAMGRRGYIGPMPIPSHGPHSYVFQLFALDTTLSLPDGFTLAQLTAAMEGHVIGRARLDGTFEVA